MLLLLTAVLAIWMGINYAGPGSWHFDRSPGRDLLLFNLFLSLIGSYTSPVILFKEAASRAANEARDAALSDAVQRTESASAYLADEISYIDIAVSEAVTRAAWREEMRALREHVAKRHPTGPQRASHRSHTGRA